MLSYEYNYNEGERQWECILRYADGTVDKYSAVAIPDKTLDFISVKDLLEGFKKQISALSEFLRIRH